MIRIRLKSSTEATFDGGRWACQDRRLEQLLNAMRAPWEALGPRRELAEARVVSKVLGAEIVESRF